MMTSAALPPTAINLLKMSRTRYKRNLADAFSIHDHLLQDLAQSTKEIAEILKDINTIDKELEALGG